MNSYRTARWSAALPIVAIALSLLAVTSTWFRQPSNQTATRVVPENSLDRIKRTRVIRAGYGGFPPYTMLDPTVAAGENRVRGFAVDLMEEIARRHNPPLKVEWQKVNWETLRADLASDRVDVLADALYQTVTLGADFALTEPFSYFGIGCALVRKDEGRFQVFADLDREDITIAVAVGWLSTDYAKQRLKKPKFKDVVVAESPNVQLDEVLFGRADVAVQDVPTVLAYARAHADKVKALWTDSAPATVAGGFAVRRQDRDLLEFLNVGFRVLRTDGTIDTIDARWSGMGYYVKTQLIPGSGLTGTKGP